MGGEKGSTSIVLPMTLGLPPRRRGKVAVLGRFLLLGGITPAWAGKRTCGFGDRCSAKDHPRMGGEKERLSRCAAWAEGSPPRGRGKGSGSADDSHAVRITPAWAGKRSARLLWRLTIGDHPRMGGEKRRTVQYPRRCVGSPPRGRGKVADGLLAGACPGITPAWAGKR